MITIIILIIAALLIIVPVILHLNPEIPDQTFDAEVLDRDFTPESSSTGFGPAFTSNGLGMAITSSHEDEQWCLIFKLSDGSIEPMEVSKETWAKYKEGDKVKIVCSFGRFTGLRTLEEVV